MMVDNFYHLIRNELYEKQLTSWFKQWNIPESIKETLPETGFIVDGIAAIFLYETNSKMCFIECLIRDKEATEEVSNKAIDLLIKHVLRYAKEQNYKFIMSNTKYDRVVEIAEKHGFKTDKSNYKSFGKVVL